MAIISSGIPNAAPLLNLSTHCQVYMESCRIEQSPKVSEITLASRGILELVDGLWTVRHCYFLIPEGTTMHIPRDLERFIDPASLWHPVELKPTEWHMAISPLATRIPRPR